MQDDERRCFTVDGTAYLRSLDRRDLNARCVAIHYQKPPTKTETGRSFGMRWPMLIVSNITDNPDEVAQRVADILERHWDEPATDAAELTRLRAENAMLLHTARDLLQHVDWLTCGLPEMLNDASLTDEEGLIGAATDAANSARAALAGGRDAG